jgi:IS30 family transposase
VKFLTLIGKVDGKQALPESNVIITSLDWVPAVETLTNDNGKEFAEHKNGLFRFGGQDLFCTSVFILGARNQRKRQWSYPAIFAQRA